MTRLLWILLLAGCVGGSYDRISINEPVDEWAVDELVPGDDLQLCLDALGAPIRVWETQAGRYAMAYGWLRDRGWGVRASYSYNVFVRASFSYDDQLAKLRGAVLFFDNDLKLTEARTGLLGDILPPRPRPVDVDELEELEKEKREAAAGA